MTFDHLPFDPATARRVRMTAGCRDCESIPKVPNAGEVFDRSGVAVQRMHNGVLVRADGYCGAWMTEIIRRLHGHHEPQEERAFHELLAHVSPGGVMLELGSYWAYYSLWFLHVIPNGKCFLVEPDPGNLQLGRENFALNGREGHFTHAAVGAESASPAPFHCESDGHSHPVPTICLDDYLSANRIDRVELLLCDIQGYEMPMLVGATKSIAAGKVRFAILSTHHHSISADPITHQECLRLVREMGGHVLVEHSVPESFSGDGLVVASFDPSDRSLPPITISYNRASEAFFREVEHDLGDARRELARLREEQAHRQKPHLVGKLARAAKRRLGLGPVRTAH